MYNNKHKPSRAFISTNKNKLTKYKTNITACTKKNINVQDNVQLYHSMHIE